MNRGAAILLPFCLLLAFCPFAANALPPDFFEPSSVDGLVIRPESANVTLTWPSCPGETFAILWRSNAMPEAPWVVLTNQLHAAIHAEQTSFCDSARLAADAHSASLTNLPDLYRVFVVPDFWFNMNGVLLSGGPKNPGEDFIPIYYGTKETGILRPQVELIVDGDPAGDCPDDEDVQLVSFGTPRKPHWRYATGFWLNHDVFTNGTHTLQLRALLTLNNYVGPASQYLNLTNRPVRLTTTNDITFAGFSPIIEGDACTIVAQSVEPRVNWRIAIYDSQGRLLVSKTGRTFDGDIRRTWNLRDTEGKLHDDLATDPYFAPQTTIWPLEDDAKGARRLLELSRDVDRFPWWYSRLGLNFVRKRPKPEERRQKFISMADNPLEKKTKARPLDIK